MNIHKPSSEISYLITQTRAHHTRLSGQADVKANMLLTMASIVITLSAPQAMKGTAQIPLFVLIGFSLVTILFAAYAVMPKPPARVPRTPEGPDTNSPYFNLLFFGDFTGMTYPQFEAEMERVMNNPSLTYEVQVREIYLLGTFLEQKKYRYLRLGYTVFITGLFASALAFLVTAKF